MQTLNIEPTFKNKGWKDLLDSLGADFEVRAKQYDRENRFVTENYERLKEEKVFSLAIPAQLGGGDLSHREMCKFLIHLAKYCSSTALALSMHQHLVAATIWKFKHGKGGDDVLQKVAANQLVLVSTGAGDWLSSNGEMKKTNGGYIVSASKNFSSQSPAGDVIVTSSRYHDPEKGWLVLHFSIPAKAEGIVIKDDWYAMGMRGTGSNTITFNDVFVPESAIVLERPMGEFHPVWGIVLTVAMPLIMSVYVGIAEKASEIAIATSSRKQTDFSVYLAGEMINELTIARVVLDDMIRLANNFDFEPSKDLANEILVRKTIVAKACIQTVAKAMELGGGFSYLNKSGLEKLFRDVNAGIYHPLQEKAQQEFTGKMILESGQRM